jgi:hypothetical protein
MVSIAILNNMRTVSIKYYGDSNVANLLNKMGFANRGDEKDIYFKSNHENLNMLSKNNLNWSLFEGDEDI